MAASSRRTRATGDASPVVRKTAAARRTPRNLSGRRSGDALALYRSKRSFGVTSEPEGDAPGGEAGRRFVVQKHDASRLHYDIRLEHDGVLLSWAVPKGPSLSPQDKRLAVQTEDHPVAYRSFEGTIPEGQYGAGDVIVWDHGRWEPDFDPVEGLRKGHLAFHLHGERLNGAFDLVRTRGGKAAQGPGSTWLLIKHADEHARNGTGRDITDEHQDSVLKETTGRRPAMAAKATTRRKAAPPETVAAKKSAGSKVGTKSRGALVALDDIEPQLATAVDSPPSSGRWAYEIKFDGYRLLAAADGHDVRLRSRNRLDWTRTFPAVTAALQGLNLSSSILDGELCFLNSDGTTSFQQLQRVLPRGGGKASTPVDQRNLVFYLFDLLFHDGEDLRARPLLERKERLRGLLPSRLVAPLAYSEHLETDGRAAFSQACRAGLEGLICKRADGPYVAGRSTHWLKLKCRRRQEFVIVGMAAPDGGKRTGFRSLLLGLREQDGSLRYCGKVGTGFDEVLLSDLSKRLRKLVVDVAPVTNAPKGRGLTWVRPELVAEVDFAEFTQDGLLRQASFQGLRLDKPANRVTRERAQPVAKVVARGRKATPTKDDTGPLVVGGVNISHPERIIDSPSGLSKGELAQYHEQVIELLLPYAVNRPLALVRCPDGDAAQCFFQKQKPQGTGKSVGQKRVGSHEVVFARDARGILELVQFNAIEFHGWGAVIAHPHRPDWIVMDLDPDTALPFSAVVEAAFEMREALESVGLQSFVKTTGGKGLHVVAPFEPRAGWAEVKAFTQGIATAFAAREPDRYVATVSKAKRESRIFIDYLRNSEGATAVLPYSPRARPGATVAVPMAWRDIRHLDPREFTVRHASRWLRKRRTDPWKTFFETRQGLPDLADRD